MSIKRCILLFDAVIASLLFLLVLSFEIPAFAKWLHGIEEKIEEKKSSFIVKEGDMAPQFEIDLLDGTKFSLNDMSGNLVLIQFFNMEARSKEDVQYVKTDIIGKYGKEEKFNYVAVACDCREDELLKDVEWDDKSKVANDPVGKVFNLFSKQGASVSRCVLVDEDGKILKLAETPEELKKLPEVIKNRLASF